MNKYAIVGFGCAGFHAAKAIREHDSAGVIEVFSDTGQPPYNPMLTTYYVKGAISYGEMFPFGALPEITESLGLVFHEGVRVGGIRPDSGSLVLSGGEERRFDKILVATGASAFVPPIPGAGHGRVLCMRTTDDARKLRALLDSGAIRSGLVVGASMVGIKVAEVFLKNGVDSVMVDTAPYIFPLAAFEQTGGRIIQSLEKKGIRQHYSTTLTAIAERDGRLAALFKDGSEILTDVVVMCVGTRPNTRFLEGSGVAVGRGIVVDQHMRTSRPDIYAAGDCCEAIELQSGEHRVIGLWANAGYQGRTAGENMAGVPVAFDYSIFQNITHFLDGDFVSMGDVGSCRPEDQSWTYERGDCYVRAVKGGGRIKCVNMLGMPRCSGILKNFQMKGFSGAGIRSDDVLVGLLKVEKFPLEFLDWLEN